RRGSVGPAGRSRARGFVGRVVAVGQVEMREQRSRTKEPRGEYNHGEPFFPGGKPMDGRRGAPCAAALSEGLT
ncbi:MAG: hypothetical protein ACMG6S_23040, partial [Byssovorax sp.]